MKRFVTGAMILLMATSPCLAAVKVVGKGDNTHFDPSGIPSSLKPSYDTMKVKCIKCHSLERTVVAITTGIAPITGQPFDKNASRAYGIKMLRKPDSNMNKQEVKAVVELMNYLLDGAAK